MCVKEEHLVQSIRFFNYQVSVSVLQITIFLIVIFARSLKYYWMTMEDKPL